MPPILSYIATLIVLGAAFSFLHWLILLLGLPDLMALLILAAPIVLFIAWCSFESGLQILRFALRVYIAFAATVVASAGLVYFIG